MNYTKISLVYCVNGVLICSLKERTKERRAPQAGVRSRHYKVILHVLRGIRGIFCRRAQWRADLLRSQRFVCHCAREQPIPHRALTTWSIIFITCFYLVVLGIFIHDFLQTMITLFSWLSMEVDPEQRNLWRSFPMVVYMKHSKVEL